MERRAGGGGPLMDVDAEMKAARHVHRSKQVGALCRLLHACRVQKAMHGVGWCPACNECKCM